jgi:hypothetical protein
VEEDFPLPLPIPRAFISFIVEASTSLPAPVLFFFMISLALITVGPVTLAAAFFWIGGDEQEDFFCGVGIFSRLFSVLVEV